jgi:hypothetical protein
MSDGLKPLGNLPPSARAAVDCAWLKVLSARHPEFRWTLLRPSERGERDTPAATGKIVGALTAPEDEDALLKRDGATRTTNGTNYDGVDGGGE